MGGQAVLMGSSVRGSGNPVRLDEITVSGGGDVCAAYLKKWGGLWLEGNCTAIRPKER